MNEKEEFKKAVIECCISGTMTVKQAAEKWGLSKRRIQVLCSENRIPGAMKVDSSWVIPADAEKPVDARIRSGKYIKKGMD